MLSIRAKADADLPTVVSDIQRVWKATNNVRPIQMTFYSDYRRTQYLDIIIQGTLIGICAAAAVVIACLGLFALSAFAAERRTKEIGIRKVLGARIRDIVRLLVWQFSKPIIVANLIAWPVAWYLMRDWLNNFDARIDLGPAPFIFPGLLALVIAIGTVAGHALRISRANPVHALRYE